MLARAPRPHGADMAPDHRPTPDLSLRTFLAERYRAGTSQAAARRESVAVRAAATQLSEAGRRVTLIGSLLVPTDDTVFSLFTAGSAEDVAAVGERTEQPFDRISEGIPVSPSRFRDGGTR